MNCTVNVLVAAPMSFWQAATKRLGHLKSRIARSELQRSAALLLFALWFMLASSISCILHCHLFVPLSLHIHRHAMLDHAVQTPYLCFHSETQHQPGPLPPPPPVSEAVTVVAVSLLLVLFASSLNVFGYNIPSSQVYAPPSPPPKAA